MYICYPCLVNLRWPIERSYCVSQTEASFLSIWSLYLGQNFRRNLQRSTAKGQIANSIFTPRKRFPSRQSQTRSILRETALGQVQIRRVSKLFCSLRRPRENVLLCRSESFLRRKPGSEYLDSHCTPFPLALALFCSRDSPTSSFLSTFKLRICCNVCAIQGGLS